MAILSTKKDWNEDLPPEGRDISGRKLLDFANSGFCGKNPKTNALETDVAGCNFVNCKMSNTDCRDLLLSSCDFSSADLTRADFSRSSFQNCRFNSTIMQETVLRKCSLDCCTIENVSLTSIHVDFETTFQGCVFSSSEISIRVIEDLGDVKGQLTNGQLRSLKIVDTLSDLVRDFSGFQSWLYLLLATVAFAPYVAFVTDQLMLSRLGEIAPAVVPTKSVFFNLLRFIYSGGSTWTDWNFALIGFFTFAYSSAFNAIRVLLLWKTKQLEHYRSVSGFAPILEATGFWGWATGFWGWVIRLHNWGRKWILVVIVVHVVSFLMSRVPIIDIPK